MIKQDYLLRMIQEIIALLVQALLNKRIIDKNHWAEYDNLTTQLLGLPCNDLSQLDTDAIIARYQDNPDKWELCELAAILLLKLSDEADDAQVDGLPGHIQRIRQIALGQVLPGAEFADSFP